MFRKSVQTGGRQAANTDLPGSAECCSCSWPWLKLKITPFGRADDGVAAYTMPCAVWYIIPGYGGVITLAAHTDIATAEFFEHRAMRVQV
jgi:hypothetical protein